MTENEPMPKVDEVRVADRSHLLPSEREAGSDDPEAQARAILEESDLRSLDPSAAPGAGKVVEHRRSEDTVELPD